jgi:hypothetical protein
VMCGLLLDALQFYLGLQVSRDFLEVRQNRCSSCFINMNQLANALSFLELQLLHCYFLPQKSDPVFSSLNATCMEYSQVKG